MPRAYLDLLRKTINNKLKNNWFILFYFFDKLV
jgi:hypothetical protein